MCFTILIQVCPLILCKAIFHCHSDGFTDALNGVTRFMVYLGTKKPLTRTNTLNFIHISNPNILNMKVSDSVALDSEVISSIQVASLFPCSTVFDLFVDCRFKCCSKCRCSICQVVYSQHRH